MSQTPRGKLFEDNEPQLTDEEATIARDAGKIAMSFATRPILSMPDDIEFIAVKIALNNGDFSTVLLDQYSARALQGMIDGVNGLGWKTQSLRAGPMRH